VPPIDPPDDSVRAIDQGGGESIEVVRDMLYSSHSGPVPSPEALERYERVLPGLAHRLVRMSEDESALRRGHEREKLRAAIKGMWMGFASEMAGAIFGLTVALAALLFSFRLAMGGHVIVGGICSGTTVAVLAGVFVIGRYAGSDKPADAAGNPADRD
jgi:uncharacterized membrane protein